MKTFLRFAVILLSLGLTIACSRDDDDQTKEPEPTGLEAFLSGTFDVTQVDYNGTVTFSGQSIPLNGTGTNTSGYYTFKQKAKSLDYEVNTTANVSILGQNVPVPVVVASEGPFEIVSETRFVVQDPTYGNMTYDINTQDENGFSASTRFQNDSSGVDLNMDIQYSKR